MAILLSRKPLRTFTVLLTVTLASVQSIALSQDVPDWLRNEDWTSPDAPIALRAGIWARENQGISIAITLGSDAGVDAQDLKENFETGFAKNFGVVAVAFVEINDKPGSVISYFYGPYSTKAEPFQTGAMKQRIEQVVGAYQIYRSAEGID